MQTSLLLFLLAAATLALPCCGSMTLLDDVEENGPEAIAADYGVVLFGKSPSEVARFLQSTKCVVGRVDDVQVVEGGWTATIWYPARNHQDGQLGSDAGYPQEIRIRCGDDLAWDLLDADLNGQGLVLKDADDARICEWVGLVPLTVLEAGGFDFFGERTELLYRAER